MANKTVKGVVSAVVMFLSLGVSANVYTDQYLTNLHESDSSSISKTIHTTQMSDGIEWRALYDEDSEIPKIIYGALQQPESNLLPEEIALTFLDINRDTLGMEEPTKDLILLQKTSSPGSTHVIYQQTLEGLPILDATVGVHIDNMGKIEIVTNGYENQKEVAEGGSTIMEPGKAISIVESDLKRPHASSFKGKLELGLLKFKESLHRVYRIKYSTKKPVGDWLYDIDAETGKIYSKVNMIKKLEGIGYVQYPNPDASPQRVVVNLPNLLEPPEGEKYSLKGTYFTIINSNYGLAAEEKPTFDYTYIYDPKLNDESGDSPPRRGGPVPGGESVSDRSDRSRPGRRAARDPGSSSRNRGKSSHWRHC